MPTWLVPTFKWGGIALAVIAAIAIIYVQFLAASAQGHRGDRRGSDHPLLDLLLVGVVAAIAGVVLERRKRLT